MLSAFFQNSNTVQEAYFRGQLQLPLQKPLSQNKLDRAYVRAKKAFPDKRLRLKEAYTLLLRKVKQQEVLRQHTYTKSFSEHRVYNPSTGQFDVERVIKETGHPDRRESFQAPGRRLNNIDVEMLE